MAKCYVAVFYQNKNKWITTQKPGYMPFTRDNSKRGREKKRTKKDSTCKC